MSGQATGWVLRHGPAPKMRDTTGKPYGARARGLRAVLVTIADAANRDGDHAHPGVPAMVDGSLYSKRQVLNIVSQLVDDGWVEITEQGNGRGHATVYRVCMSRETVQPVHSSSDRNGEMVDTKRCNGGDETVQPCNGAPLSLNGNNGRSNVPSLPDVTTKSEHLDVALMLCDRFAQQLEDRGYVGSLSKSRSKRWIIDMEQLLRIDGKTAEQVRVMLDWLDKGDHEVSLFWRTTVRSPAKLRLQWPTIIEQYQSAKARTRSHRRGEDFGMERGDVDRIVQRSRNGNGGDHHPSDSALSVSSGDVELVT